MKHRQSLRIKLRNCPHIRYPSQGWGEGGGGGGGERVDYTISSLIPAVITDNHYQNLTVII